jgi:hypothetical protein
MASISALVGRPFEVPKLSRSKFIGHPKRYGIRIDFPDHRLDA